jgi:flavodoxin
MRTLVVYDSLHGNTEKIAEVIGGAIDHEVQTLRIGEVNMSELKELDLLIVGGPTHAGRASENMKEFLNKIPKSTLKGTNVAAFDTRIPSKWVKVFGFAASKIANKLKKKGGILIGDPEGFFVEDTEGPLRECELERAAVWAKGICKLIKNQD